MPNIWFNWAIKNKANIMWAMASVAALSALAIYNGYPLVFFDSGTYIRQVLRLEGALDRPPFYSFFLLFVHLKLSLWPVPIVQNIIVVTLAFRALSLAFPELKPANVFRVIILAAVTTTLPWFSNQVMPDIFTPLIVLSVFCIVVGWTQVGKAEKVALSVSLCAMCSFHTASPVFAAIIAAGAVIVAYSGQLVKREAVIATVGAVLMAMVAQTLYTYTVTKRISPSAYTPVFLLGRLIGDGSARRFLAVACPTQQYVLCSRQGELTDDTDFFLWDPRSPLSDVFRQLGTSGALDEAAAIVRGTVTSFPRSVVTDAVLNSLRQFTSVVPTNECPCLTGTKINDVVAEFFPNEFLAFSNSGQNTRTLPVVKIAQADIIILVLSVVFIGAIVLIKPDVLRGHAWRLLMLISLGTVVNAALMGALSSVADRYQARLIWLVPLFAYALLFSGRVGTKDRKRIVR